MDAAECFESIVESHVRVAYWNAVFHVANFLEVALVIADCLHQGRMEHFQVTLVSFLLANILNMIYVSKRDVFQAKTEDSMKDTNMAASSLMRCIMPLLGLHFVSRTYKVMHLGGKARKASTEGTLAVQDVLLRLMNREMNLLGTTAVLECISLSIPQILLRMVAWTQDTSWLSLSAGSVKHVLGIWAPSLQLTWTVSVFLPWVWQVQDHVAEIVEMPKTLFSFLWHGALTCSRSLMLISFASVAGYVVFLGCVAHSLATFGVHLASIEDRSVKRSGLEGLASKALGSVLTVFTFVDCQKFDLSRCFYYYFLSFLENVLVFYGLLYLLSSKEGQEADTSKGNLEILSVGCVILYFLSAIPMIFYYLVLEYESPLTKETISDQDKHMQ